MAVIAPIHIVTDQPDASVFADHLLQAPNLDAAIHHAHGLIVALGLDPDDEHLKDTPTRMAKQMIEMLTGGNPFDVTTFKVPDDQSEEMVVITDIPLVSFCSHHLLPFTGVAHVGYIPNERIVGLSKIPRIINMYAHRPQVQERLTTQIANHLNDILDAKGVGVVLSARHACMELRGVCAVGSQTITSCYRGAVTRTDLHRAIETNRT